jgi:molybdopterin converting factor small subunit
VPGVVVRSPRPLRILLFASAREAVGRGGLDWPVPPDGTPAATVLADLEQRYPRLRRTLKVSRFVRNGEYLDDLSTPLAPGDEFAVHPPYGGG